MINKNKINMKKTTVFEGFINGEKFDSVAAYNTRMNQLIETGTTNIDAHSSTSIKMVNDESTETSTVETKPEITTTATCPDCCCDPCECEDFAETYNLFPFFEDNDCDTTYLDELVTDDDTENKNILANIENTLIDSTRDVTDFLYSLEIDRDDKEEYLEEIRDILVTLNNDAAKNQACIDIINDKRKEAEAKFEAARKEYNETCIQLDTHKATLTRATPVLNKLTEFYRGAECEAIAALVEMKEVEDAHKDITECTKTSCNKKSDTKFDFVDYLAKVAKLYGIDLK